VLLRRADLVPAQLGQRQLEIEKLAVGQPQVGRRLASREGREVRIRPGTMQQGERRGERRQAVPVQEGRW
jgi:hypothetical protein